LVSNPVALLVVCAAAAAEAVLIKNTKAGEVSADDARLIFTLRITRYSDGTLIKVFVLPRDSATTRDFSMSYMKMTAFRWWELLDSYAVSGKSNLPIVVDTEQDMYRAITSNENAIGYINEFILINTGKTGDITTVNRFRYR